VLFIWRGTNECKGKSMNEVGSNNKRRLFKLKSPGEPGDLLCGWVSKYREINFPSQY
jgi:hypothetical protein